MRRALVLAAAMALAAASPAQAKPKRAVPKLPLLHGVRGERAHIADAQGRQVLLRGANVNQLGDYFKWNEHPPSAPLLRSDFRAMRRLGWNSVRLITHWSLWEPAPGTFSEEYLARVRQAVQWARAEGIYTLIDMHQDAWGKYIAADEGTVCPPGMVPNRGWDGAPEWATLTDGLPRCNSQSREISPAVNQAFQSFYDDRAGPGGAGIQTRLLAVWERIAREFASEDAVMGYDLLNEPHPTATATGFESLNLFPYYRRAIAAIRKHDRRHLIAVEPTVLRSGFPELIQMSEISDDPNLIYAPHIYGDRNNPQHSNPGHVNEAAEWEAAAKEARDAGGASGALPLWIGEFGALDPNEENPDDPRDEKFPPNRDEYNREFMETAEQFRVGWSHWVWKDTCGDPHHEYSPFPDESVHIYDCPSDRFTRIKANRVFHYSRPYPQHTVGRIEKLSFDEKTKKLELKVAAKDGVRGHTIVFIPLRVHYGGKLKSLRVRTEGVARSRLRRLPDGNATLSLRPKAGGHSLIVERP